MNNIVTIPLNVRVTRPVNPVVVLITEGPYIGCAGTLIARLGMDGIIKLPKSDSTLSERLDTLMFHLPGDSSQGRDPRYIQWMS